MSTEKDRLETIMRIQGRVSAALDSIVKKHTLEGEIFTFVTEKWGPKSGLDVGLKLSEETGELCGAITRVNENRGTVDQIADELGDVLIVASQVAFILGTTIEQIRAGRWEQVKARNKEDERTKLSRHGVEYRDRETLMTSTPIMCRDSFRSAQEMTEVLNEQADALSKLTGRDIRFVWDPMDRDTNPLGNFCHFEVSATEERTPDGSPPS